MKVKTSHEVGMEVEQRFDSLEHLGNLDLGSSCTGKDMDDKIQIRIQIFFNVFINKYIELYPRKVICT